jgi:hypothetical protein
MIVPARYKTKPPFCRGVMNLRGKNIGIANANTLRMFSGYPTYGGMSFQKKSIEKAFGRLLINATLKSKAGRINRKQFDKYFISILYSRISSLTSFMRPDEAGLSAGHQYS